MGMDDRYQLSAGEIASEVIRGDAVVLNLASGVYYSLQGAGALAWALLERGHTPTEAAAVVAEHFGIAPHRAEQDVGVLLGRLREEGLLKEADEGAEPQPVPEDALPPRGALYATPSLERFDDMGDLLAIDPPMPGLSETPWESPKG
jgi:hypothetical protein